MLAPACEVVVCWQRVYAGCEVSFDFAQEVPDYRSILIHERVLDTFPHP